MDDIKLQWVVVSGTLNHVSDYACLPTHQRPQAACPVCEQSVILKLGPQRAHHAAHSPGSDCALTNPETALHFNTKIYIAQQLRNADALTIQDLCPICYSTRRELWISDWDQVEVEYGFEHLRPDITFFSDEKAVGAIEVIVTHAVEAPTANRMADLELPWIEVAGTARLYSGVTAWTADKPLPVVRRSGAIACDRCNGGIPEIEQRNVVDSHWFSIQELEDPGRKMLSGPSRTEVTLPQKEDWSDLSPQPTSVFSKDPVVPMLHKVVDFYYPSGRHYRETYAICVIMRDGEDVEALLVNSKSEILARHPLTERFENQEEIVQALTRIERRRMVAFAKNGAIIDSRMPWVADEHFSDDDDYPSRYCLNTKTGKWFMREDAHDLIWHRDNGTYAVPPYFRERAKYRKKRPEHPGYITYFDLKEPSLGH